MENRSNMQTRLVPGVGRLPYPAYRGNDPYIFVSYAHLDSERVFAEIKRFNDRLWNKVEKADLAKTDFVISYMKNDDYDPNGYSDLIEHLTDKEANIYGKGIIGRHNDNTSEVVEWFVKRYKRILERSFGR